MGVPVCGGTPMIREAPMALWKGGANTSTRLSWLGLPESESETKRHPGHGPCAGANAMALGTANWSVVV